MSSDRPIAVFDSGIGGLSVLNELRKALPYQPFIYLSDSKHHPFGEKTPEHLSEILEKNISFLRKKNAKLIIVACHTASLHGQKLIQTRFDIPIIGMEQATIEAVVEKNPKSLGILGTKATIASNIYPSQLKKKFSLCPITSLAAPFLVECIERKKELNSENLALIEKTLLPFTEKKLDAILLACTHFPYLKELIQQFTKCNMIIDPSSKLVEEILFLAEENGWTKAAKRSSKVQYLDSSNRERIEKLLSFSEKNPSL